MGKVRKAVDFYRDFHWGDDAEEVIETPVAPVPSALTEIGTLRSVVYETHKGGEHATWEHEFGEEGGEPPTLAVDPENEKLHIVGGTYTVEPRGIVD